MYYFKTSKINGAGNAKFDFEHASDYVILVTNEATIATSTTTILTEENNPKTGDNSMLPILLIAILSVTVFAVVNKKRKAL